MSDILDKYGYCSVRIRNELHTSRILILLHRNLDLYTGSWMHYTYRGEHIETIPMSDSLYMELKPECIADIKPIDSDHFLAVYSDYPDIEYKYYLLSRKDMSVVDSFVKTRHFEGLEFQASTLSVVGVDEVLTFAEV